MTSPLGATDPTTTNTTAGLAKTAASMGKDQFLQLLVAQLKNQDPTSPMDGTQFAAQLAQFSTVEQLVTMNSKLDAQSTAAAQSEIAQQASFANSLIGRSVILNGANISVASDGTAQVNVDLTTAAKTVHIDILGTDGKTVVANQDIQGVSGGNQTLNLNLGALKAGNYAYKVTAVDSSGKSLPITGNTVGQVQAMVFQNGQVMVRVNGSVVPVTDITEVIPAAPATGSTKTN